jgi:hypothetical protein
MTEIIGKSENGRGVYGESKTGQGVWGSSESDSGVVGVNGGSGAGVLGTSANGRGVYGESQSGQGVWGYSQSDKGVVGVSANGRGVYGDSVSGQGVWGYSQSDSGVVGQSTKGRGVYGESGQGQGLWGHSQSDNGVVGVSETGVGLFGKGGRAAGHFEGNIEVTGDVEVTGNIEVITGDIRLTAADCAEDFTISAGMVIEPGLVMVLTEEGTLSASREAYDKRVVGVISGAGDYKPGIVLDRTQSEDNRQPIALLGKVFCKIDARYGPIEVGDLLTTSPTYGHAMKAADPSRAFGAVIGKALRSFKEGRGLIPILIALQ